MIAPRSTIIAEDDDGFMVILLKFDVGVGHTCFEYVRQRSESALKALAQASTGLFLRTDHA